MAWDRPWKNKSEMEVAVPGTCGGWSNGLRHAVSPRLSRLLDLPPSLSNLINREHNVKLKSAITSVIFVVAGSNQVGAGSVCPSFARAGPSGITWN